MEIQNAELQEINEQLLLELEKRDKAVEEAVGIICDLEEKVKVLEEWDDKREATPLIHSPRTDGPPHDDVPRPLSSSSPSTAAEKQEPKTPHSKQSESHVNPMGANKSNKPGRPSISNTPSRTPSFLTSDKGSAGALRSLYLAGENHSRGGFGPFGLSRRNSMLSREDGFGSPESLADGLDSPRLSILSEGDFLSVYGDTTRLDLNGNTQNLVSQETSQTQAPEQKAREERVERERKQTRAERLQQWMDERGTPSKVPRAPSSGAIDAEKYLSIGNVLQGRLPPPKEDLAKDSPRKEMEAFMSRRQEPKSQPSAPFTSGSPLGAHPLPFRPASPSPVGQNASNNSSSSIIAERSLLDSTPAPVKSFAALRPDIRPHSAGGETARSTNDSFNHYDSAFDYADSDGELDSMLAGHDEHDYDNDQINLGNPSFFSAISPSAARILGNVTPSKSHFRSPAYRGDMMFNGEVVDEAALTRSHASPTGLNHDRRHSVQFDFDILAHPGLSRSELCPTSPCDRRSRSSKTVTPTKSSVLHQSRSEESNGDRYLDHNPSTPPSKPATTKGVTFKPEPEFPQSSSRFRVPKLLLTPSPTKRSLKDRIFRRSATVESSPAEPSSPIIRNTASYSARAQRPHGALARSNTANDIQLAAAIRHRPGTASSVEGKNRHQLRGQSSGSTWEGSSGGDGIWTPTTERGESMTSEDVYSEFERDRLSRSDNLVPEKYHSATGGSNSMSSHSNAYGSSGYESAAEEGRAMKSRRWSVSRSGGKDRLEKRRTPGGRSAEA